MKQSACLPFVAALLALPFAARAEVKSEIVFSQKAWQVEVVTYDDGTTYCAARVTDETGDRSLTIWADPDATIELQFYDSGWDLGTNQTANLVVQIDRRSPWNLTNADLNQQSVLFTLPTEGDEGVNFVAEVMRGNVLYLNAEDGSAVENYSLAGSSASINALIDCVDALSKDANPFN